MNLYEFSAVDAGKGLLVKMKLLLVVCLAVAASCAVAPRRPNAVVDFVPGNAKVSGRLQLYRTDYAGVLIQGRVSGLTPGHHGFHVHAEGDLSGKCTAAGGHFNPFQTNHGSPYDNPIRDRHVGDLGNIQADRYGNADIYIHDTVISLDPASHAYIGNKAIVIHQGRDDLGRGGNPDSLKTGNAGGRAGCGLIVPH
ncbi:superoxide dismutase [Cu-Zn]-like isoform X1 [Scylla paramamosain]|uniref:superoxide dismutase [Cu-Zn]-like isoform X1 n=2 Tax=Scylla paramamosain TaxID=85552 RepID=UPI003082D418